MTPLSTELCKCAVRGGSDATGPQALPSDTDPTVGGLGLNGATRLGCEDPGRRRRHRGPTAAEGLGGLELAVEESVPLTLIQRRKACFDSTRPTVRGQRRTVPNTWRLRPKATRSKDEHS
eukprot:6067128-Amphidinium_carterae.2